METIGRAAFIGIIICVMAIITGGFALLAKVAGAWIWWLLGGLLGIVYVLGIGLIITTLRGAK